MLRITLLLLLFNNSISLRSQPVPQDVFPAIYVDVGYLSSDLLEGRSPGTRGEELAAMFIANRMDQIGVSPYGKSYFQPFTFVERANPHVEQSTDETHDAKNIIGYIDNQKPYTIIIGAHYDHLGWGDSGSLYTGEPAIHNGADDNASGVAAMLEIARQLLLQSEPTHNYMFIAFSGEEMGLMGSNHYAKHPVLPFDDVSAMINLDMVGRLNEEKVLIINGVKTSPRWEELLTSTTHPFHLNMHDSGIGPSDHTSFYLQDVPVLHFFTGQHMDYHKPSDDAQLINYKGIQLIADYITAIVSNLNDGKTQLEFTETAQDEERKAANFKVTLGVMPDYAYTGTGMRIDGIIKNRPAAKADLLKGDIIIQMGDLEVKDIYDYMEGLSKYESGDSVTVLVKRGDETVTKTVTF